MVYLIILVINYFIMEFMLIKINYFIIVIIIWYFSIDREDFLIIIQLLINLIIIITLKNLISLIFIFHNLF